MKPAAKATARLIRLKPSSMLARVLSKRSNAPTDRRLGGRRRPGGGAPRLAWLGPGPPRAERTAGDCRQGRAESHHQLLGRSDHRTLKAARYAACRQFLGFLVRAMSPGGP